MLRRRKRGDEPLPDLMTTAQMSQDWNPAASSPFKEFKPREFHEPFSAAEIYYLRRMALQYFYMKMVAKVGSWALGAAILMGSLLPVWNLLGAHWK